MHCAEVIAQGLQDIQTEVTQVAIDDPAFNHRHIDAVTGSGLRTGKLVKVKIL